MNGQDQNTEDLSSSPPGQPEQQPSSGQPPQRVQPQPSSPETAPEPVSAPPVSPVAEPIVVEGVPAQPVVEDAQQPSAPSSAPQKKTKLVGLIVVVVVVLLLGIGFYAYSVFFKARIGDLSDVTLEPAVEESTESTTPISPFDFDSTIDEVDSDLEELETETNIEESLDLGEDL